MTEKPQEGSQDPEFEAPDVEPVSTGFVAAACKCACGSEAGSGGGHGSTA